MAKMFAAERRKLILNLLQQYRRITVKQTSKSLEVSEATLRTDLKIMEQEGLLTRTHGGAVLNERITPATTFSERAMKNIEYKKSITSKAIPLIKRKDCILLDASTTALELARNLKEKDIKLTVVTNGISAALEMKENAGLNVILLGGMARKGSMALEGLLGLEILDKINIDLMFTSASGFTIEEGLTDFNVYEVELKKEMVKKSNKVIALLDHTKIGINSISRFATVEQIDTLITDKSTPDNLLKTLSSHQINVIN